MKYGEALRLMSITEAKEEVMTTWEMAGFVAAAERIVERTPFMAGKMSSFSLRLCHK